MNDEDNVRGRTTELARLNADIAFLQDRTRRIEADYLEEMNALGVTDVIPLREWTPETAEETLRSVVAYCRRAGNHPLADNWSAAFNGWKQADARLDTLIAQGGAAGLEAARDAADDALEQFERVDAELADWFDRQG